MALRRAFLLYERGQLGQARRILDALPRDPDVDDLLAKIAAEEGREKSIQERLRGLRYELNLNTSEKRAGAYLVAAASACYGAYELVRAGMYAAAHGIASEITTQVNTGGRYTSHLVDYTRPIYFDLLYGAGFLCVGIFVILLVLRIARGAAEWEELDASSPDYDTGRWFWRW